MKSGQSPKKLDSIKPVHFVEKGGFYIFVFLSILALPPILINNIFLFSVYTVIKGLKLLSYQYYTEWWVNSMCGYKQQGIWALTFGLGLAFSFLFPESFIIILISIIIIILAIALIKC